MKIYRVADVGQHIKELLSADDLLTDLWIKGEVTNLSRSTAGHYYFTLKDETAQLRSVLFRTAALRCGAEPKPGDSVVAHGRISFYERNGSCELCVDLLYPSGVGVAQLRFEALRLKLEQEGLFAPQRKRALPRYPRRIGLVTSEGGAVLHDVLTVLTRRYPIAEVVVAHTIVQGERAAEEIVAALGRMRRWRAADGNPVDVVIVGRGGGSPEELASFNDERVARSIFGSPWPVISAVGHETDVTICDYVADVRAATPSAAAELVAPDLSVLADEVDALARRGRSAIQQTLDVAQRAVNRARERLILHAPSAQIARRRQEILQELKQAQMVLSHRISTAQEHIRGRRLQMAALNPRATMGRGYCIVTLPEDSSSRVVRSAREVAVEQELEIQLLDGAVDARSTRIRTTDQPEALTPSRAPSGDGSR